MLSRARRLHVVPLRLSRLSLQLGEAMASEAQPPRQGPCWAKCLCRDGALCGNVREQLWPACACSVPVQGRSSHSRFAMSSSSSGVLPIFCRQSASTPCPRASSRQDEEGGRLVQHRPTFLKVTFFTRQLLPAPLDKWRYASQQPLYLALQLLYLSFNCGTPVFKPVLADC